MSGIGLASAQLMYQPAGGGISQLTGDVTAGPGSGVVAATIPNGTVTYAKMQVAGAASIIVGRGTAGGTGLREITLGTNLSMTGDVLNASSGTNNPAGAAGDIQYYDGGLFGAEAAFNWNKTTNTLSADGAAIFNDSGADADFRIEGDTDANTFVVDASANRVGIGVLVPASRLHITAAADGLGSALTLGTVGVANGYINTGASIYLNINSGAGSSGESFTVGTGRVGFTGGTKLLQIIETIKAGVFVTAATPDGTWHIMTASAGTISAHAVADDLIVENSDHVGLQFLCPNTKTGYILFGDPDNNSAGQIYFDHAVDTLAFFAGGVDVQVWKAGNSGIGTSTFGTSAARVLAIATGTEPTTSPADMVQLFSVDISAGNASLGLRTETAVQSAVTASDRYLNVRINGTTYKLLLAT